MAKKFELSCNKCLFFIVTVLSAMQIKITDARRPSVCHEQNEILAWMCDLDQSYFFVGSVIGIIIIGFISDRYGRLPAFFIATLFGVLGVLGLSRFLSEFAVDTIFLTMCIIVFENHNPKWPTFMLETAFTIGLIVTKWIPIGPLFLIAIGLGVAKYFSSTQNAATVKEWRLNNLSLKLRNLVFILIICITLCYEAVHGFTNNSTSLLKLFSSIASFYMPAGLFITHFKSRNHHIFWNIIHVSILEMANSFKNQGMIEGHITLMAKLTGACRYALIIAIINKALKTDQPRSVSLAQILANAYVDNYIHCFVFSFVIYLKLHWIVRLFALLRVFSLMEYYGKESNSSPSTQPLLSPISMEV